MTPIQVYLSFGFIIALVAIIAPHIPAKFSMQYEFLFLLYCFLFFINTLLTISVIVFIIKRLLGS